MHAEVLIVPQGSSAPMGERKHIDATRPERLQRVCRAQQLPLPVLLLRLTTDAAIEETTDGYFQLRTVLILGLGNAADAIEILSIGYILAVYEDKEGTLTRAEQSVLAAAIFAGMFVGGICFGALSDQIGRRKSLLYSLLVNALFALLSSVSPNIYALIVFRIGGTVPAMFTLCSEHVPVNRRGFYVTIVASYWMVGSVFTAGLAWFMLGDADSHYSWRSFAAIVSMPAFVCWYLTYRYVPESAQYFARRRQFSDAEAIVNHIHLINGNGEGRGKDKNAFVHEATGLLSPFEGSATPDASYSTSIESDYHGMVRGASEKTLADTYRSLFDPILRTTTISLLMSWFCLSFGSYGLATWITVLFKRIGLSDPFANAFIYAAANLPGNLLSAFFMDKLGGRKILAMSMLLSAACAAGFAYVSAGDDEDVDTTTTVLIVLLASGFNAFSTSGWNAIDLMSAESFPTDVRTTGMGLLSASGRTGSVIAQFINGYLVGPPPHITLLLTVTATMMLLGSISSVLVRDYNGKTLPASVEAMRSGKEAKLTEFVRIDKH
ncbi:Synaptic vesicle glycoprotein 2a, partial [Globisporangium splendens]